MFSVLFLSTGFKAADTYKYKSIFIYNFTKYIKWPGEPSIIQIGLVSDNPKVAETFNLMAEKKSSPNRGIEIIKFDASDDLPDGLEVIFIAKDKSDKLPAISGHYQGKNTLIVTESEGALQKGSCINFILKDDKLKFELKESHLEEAELKASKKLLSLAILK